MTELADPSDMGTALTLQTSMGFALTLKDWELQTRENVPAEPVVARPGAALTRGPAAAHASDERELETARSDGGRRANACGGGGTSA